MVDGVLGRGGTGRVVGVVDIICCRSKLELGVRVEVDHEVMR